MKCSGCPRETVVLARNDLGEGFCSSCMAAAVIRRSADSEPAGPTAPPSQQPRPTPARPPRLAHR